MFPLNKIRLLTGICLTFLVTGCNPKVDVFAPEKELYSVIGILNQRNDEQFVKIGKVYQFEGDAYAYAGSEDLSVKNLEVYLVGAGKDYPGELVADQPRNEGVFLPFHSYFKFNTSGVDSLVPGEVYKLEIHRPGDSLPMITASTLVPHPPVLLSPGKVLYSPMSDLYTYETIEFNNDYTTKFKSIDGKGFEVRVYIDFTDGNNDYQTFWGPTRVFITSLNCSANESRNEYCYQIPDATVPNGLRVKLENFPGPLWMNDTLKVAHSEDSLSKVARFEVTAIDTFLTAYLHSNTPFGYGLNLLMDKKEVSNISGDNVGIFGSINTSFRYINLGYCTKFKAGLESGTPGSCD